MIGLEKFKEQAQRVLSIPSHAESGNEELARYLQSLMHDFGFKTQLQPVSHSLERLSKRQFNLIGFSSDNLVDRSTRRGMLFINPLDVTTGNLPHLWTATQGNPHAPVTTDKKIFGAGAAQGKLDFLCRIYGALELLNRRHKHPLYLVGTCASNFGMTGTKFLIESLAVNPKEVYTFAPSKLHQGKKAPGQLTYTLEIDTSGRDRDPRGYNRCVDLTAYGVSVDFSSPTPGSNAFDLLMDALLDATAKGFDFEWTSLEVKGAEGANPDLARAQICLTSFQFEDFRKFLKVRLNEEQKERFFRVEYSSVAETGTRFIPHTFIEFILELDFEFKNFVRRLNEKPDKDFFQPNHVGALVRIQPKGINKLAVTFELRYLPVFKAAQLDEEWRSVLRNIEKKYEKIHFQVLKDFAIPEVLPEQPGTGKNSNYLSDAGWFHKSKFPVTILGAGSVEELPKGPNESILWSELEAAIHTYQKLMMTVCG